MDDFVPSLTTERPAGPVIVEPLGWSAAVVGMSIVLVAIIGVALGIHSAMHIGALRDRVLTLGRCFRITAAKFFRCILVIVLFAI